MNIGKDNRKFDLVKRLNSFPPAFRGIKELFLNEHNSRIHLFTTIVVLLLGLVFRIDLYKWIAVIFSIGLVFTTELINSAIEKTVDLLSPEYNKKAGLIKDFAAGAVLFASMMAVIVGLIVFIPEFLQLIRK